MGFSRNRGSHKMDPDIVRPLLEGLLKQAIYHINHNQMDRQARIAARERRGGRKRRHRLSHGLRAAQGTNGPEG